MTHHAIGEPGGRVRVYVSASPDVVSAQVRDGEVALAVERVIVDATISADGLLLVPPAPDPGKLLLLVRVERDMRLAATDWIVSRSYERGAPVPAEWADYRQALRDLPVAQPEATLKTVVWPTPPSP